MAETVDRDRLEQIGRSLRNLQGSRPETLTGVLDALDDLVVACTNTRGERLAWAVERFKRQGRHRGIGLLILKLRERGTQGASYPSINSYLRDKVDPPLDFIEAAADILGVRSGWLAFGDGAPTTRGRSASDGNTQDKADEAL